MDTPRVSDLTVDELWALLREKMQTLIREELHDALGNKIPEKSDLPTLDDFPVDDLGPWPEGLTLRREELYGDDER